MGSNRNDKMSGISRKTFLRDVNPYLICPLCRGYLIDATTVVECLHSFCRSCILKHLKNEAHCPSCKDILNKAKPNIKADKALQDIVYKLVPGLYHKEMRRRKEFYTKHPEHGYAENLNHLGGAELATPEQRGEDAASSRLFFAPEDAVSLSLEYLPPGVDPIDMDITHNNVENKNSNSGTSRRYLQCPALVTIAHLKKFLALKYNVDITRYNIDICHRRAPLPEYLTLMDVAYIYAWKRNAPMRFFYMITKEEQQLEAPPNDRPSTPGLGATFPPAEDTETITNSENSLVTDQIDTKCEKSNLNQEQLLDKQQEYIIDKQPIRELKSESVEKLLKEETFVKQSVSTESNPIIIKENTKEEENAQQNIKDQALIDNPVKEKGTDESLENKIKSPLKMLKNSDGSYAVKSSNNSSNQKQHETASAESNSDQTEFSIVSINNGSNSNGVKMTLKQCSPGNNVCRKPKVISNVLLRSPGDKSVPIVQQIKEANKNSPHLHKKEDSKPLDSGSNLKSIELPEKVDKTKRKVSFVDKSFEPEAKKPKYSEDQKTKKEFLQSFQLTATEDCKTSPSSEIKIDLKSPKKEETVKLLASSGAIQKKESPTELKPGPSLSKSDTSPINKNMDVYTFPNESPPIAGAVKRKCPPGLVITDVAMKNSFNNQDIRNMKTNYINKPKSYRKMMKETNSPSKQQNTNFTKPPMSIVDTRNLLDECGLNIPAGLSITLATSKPNTNYNYPPESTTTMKLTKATNKTNLVKNSTPKNNSIPNQDNTAKNRFFKPESPDVLDLSNSRTPEFHPPRAHRLPKVPLPAIKSKSANNQSALPKKGQVVTLTGGQKYYRAPPGSLTPAAHRMTDYPTSSRTPVYAPNLLGTSSNNLSAAFPTLQSLYVQYQRDRFKNVPQESVNKTHLVTQCPPAKPARSSLAVPKQQSSNGHLYIKKVLANDTRMANMKHVTFDKPSSVVQTPTSSATVGSSMQPKEITSPSCADRSAASPRVSSTVSPSPPPATPTPTSDSTNETKVPSEKSPESPDSSSIVENKPNDKKDKMEQDKKDQKEIEQDLQKRLLEVAFPSKEWMNNPISQEHLDKIIKNLKCRVENKEIDKTDKKQGEEKREVEERGISKESAS